MTWEQMELSRSARTAEETHRRNKISVETVDIAHTLFGIVPGHMLHRAFSGHDQAPDNPYKKIKDRQPHEKP